MSQEYIVSKQGLSMLDYAYLHCSTCQIELLPLSELAQRDGRTVVCESPGQPSLQRPFPLIAHTYRPANFTSGQSVDVGADGQVARGDFESP